MRPRPWVAILLSATVLFLVAAAAGVRLAGKGPAAQTPAELPPVSWTCPMHPEVLDDKKGFCPICKPAMALVPIRLESVWSCPVHPVVAQSKPGKCPIDHVRDLVQVTVALSWTCPDHPEIEAIYPGKCPDESPMIAKRTPRPHGNHNPQHGGLFFMAPDSWHHIEGTYPRLGVFRMHFYDDYAKPLPADKLKLVKARLVTKETFDSRTATSQEITAHPLVPAANGQYMEAKIESLPVPAQMTAKIAFTPGAPEYRFDFVFPSVTKDSEVPVSAPATTAAVGQPAASAPSTAAAETAEDRAKREAALKELQEYDVQVRGVMESGAYGAMYLPALKAKDVALALVDLSKNMPPGRRDMLEPAVKEVVLAAWMIDMYGDLGNKEEIATAYKAFSDGVTHVESALGGRP